MRREAREIQWWYVFATTIFLSQAILLRPYDNRYTNWLSVLCLVLFALITDHRIRSHRAEHQH